MSIQSISSFIEESVRRIAPERLAELTEVFRRHAPTFNWTTAKARLPSVKVETGVISIPYSGAELLWATSFKYWVLYSEYIKEQSENSSLFDLLGNRRRMEAHLVYYWALNFYRSPGNLRIPSLPAPQANAQEGSDIHVANELFLCAMGWILSHEIAHLTSGHTSITSKSREEEEDADLKATRWVLDSITDPKMRQKRILGICTAILLLTGLDLDSGVFDDRTHPKSFIRLNYCLQEANLNEDDLAYAFSTWMIRVYLTLAGQALPDDEGTLKAIFEAHLLSVRAIDQTNVT